MNGRADLLDLLRAARRCAADKRKLLLSIYGLLAFAPLFLLVVAAGRSHLHGGFVSQVQESFLRPVQATVDLGKGILAGGRWGTFAVCVVGLWFAVTLVASFFGLAITRMAAVELTGGRRADLREALRFARRQWFWALLTPASLFGGGLALACLATLLLALGDAAGLVMVIAAPVALALVAAAGLLVVGYLLGGSLAAPTLATEWSDSFDSIARVFGYSFTHAFRLFVYRLGAALALLVVALSRLLRTALALALFTLVLTAGLGTERASLLLNEILLEPPDGPPLPRSLAGWAVFLSVAAFLTAQLARLLVFRLALRQAVYLLLRLRVDKIPLGNIDGYKPDDTAYDPVAQGFELAEVEEEIRAE
ncbi:MAG: hypothetical protein ACT4PV_13390 [Planctomycetaceae bacterium]